MIPAVRIFLYISIDPARVLLDPLGVHRRLSPLILKESPKNNSNSLLDFFLAGVTREFLFKVM